MNSGMPTRRSFLQTATAAVAAPRDLTISNSSFTLSVEAGPRGVWIDKLTPAGVSENLLYSSPGEAVLRSGTALLPEGGQWCFSRLGAAGRAEATANRIRVEGVLLGPESAPIARETWELTLEGASFRWRIEREFLHDVALAATRFPALVVRTHGGKRFLEVPGFLDTSMQLDGIRMWPLHMPGAEHYEALSARRAQILRFAPSGIGLESSFETGLFSYAKPFADGTSGAVGIGAETVDRARGASRHTAGSRQTQVWDLRLVADASVPFDLALPDRFLGEQSRSLASVHNQWMGWLFGNNPASVPVLQEMGWYPMIQSIYPRNPATLEALE